MVRWAPCEEIPADDLTKLNSNVRLLQVMAEGSRAPKDSAVAKKLSADAAARKSRTGSGCLPVAGMLNRCDGSNTIPCSKGGVVDSALPAGGGFRRERVVGVFGVVGPFECY